MQTISPLRPVQYKWLGSPFIAYFGSKFRLMTAPRSNLLHAASNHSPLFTKAMKKQNLIFNTNKPNAVFSTSSARFSEAWLSSTGVIRVPVAPRGPDEVCNAHLFFADCMMKERQMHTHSRRRSGSRGIGSRDATAIIGAPRSRPWYHLYHLEMAHLGMGLAGIRRDPTACHLTAFAQLRGMSFSAVKALSAVWAVWMCRACGQNESS